MNDTSHKELKEIMDPINGGYKPSRATFHSLIINLLNNHGINIRSKDGRNPEITISYPTSLINGIVLGLRYTKNDNSKTEDLFVFEEGKPIRPYYKGSLQKIFPEYEGSHKLQR